MVLETAKKKIIPCFEGSEQKSFIQLCVETDLSAGTVRFYLQVLVQAGLLEYIKGNNKKFYYNLVPQAVCIQKDGTVLCATSKGGV